MTFKQQLMKAVFETHFNIELVEIWLLRMHLKQNENMF